MGITPPVKGSFYHVVSVLHNSRKLSSMRDLKLVILKCCTEFLKLMSYVTVWQTWVSVCTHVGPSPQPMVIFSDLVIQIETSVSWPIRCGSDDLMSGWVLYLMLDITGPRSLYVCCFWIICLDTGVQPQLNQQYVWILPLGPGPWKAPARDYIAWWGYPPPAWPL